MKVLELFSGIGGMHCAIQRSGLSAGVVTAADINTVANKVYRYNFKGTPVLEKNIQSVTPAFVDELAVDIILMSPPCQPFTRVGLKKDLGDNRASVLSHIISILPEIHKCHYILLENVRGFESSDARDLLLKTLQETNFSYQEFIISPLQFGIPNSRERYYLIAKRKPRIFDFEIQTSVMTDIPKCKSNSYTTRSWNLPKTIEEILDIKDSDEENYNLFSLPVKELKRAWIMDIVTKESERSCCFTKAYSHYAEGTGSVYSPSKAEEVKLAFEKGAGLIKDSKEYTELLKPLKLRYFTPKEILRLMCFPEDFEFPPGITIRQKYRLIGNSINVAIVAQLINILTSGDDIGIR